MSLIDKLFGKKEKSEKTLAKKLKEKTAKVVAPSKSEEKKVIETQKTQSKFLSSHITEKAAALESSGQYVFKVDPRLNKIEVAREIAKTYGVKAVSVNFIKIPGKKRRVGRTSGFKPGYRKAVVKLAKGQKIELK